MKAIGIICEYNPFHSGHKLHICRSREALSLPVVCVMSGNFVQRGEAALMGKFPRAAAAIHCGADLVLELPLPWACATAQVFAGGAVSLLRQLGSVTHLSFGSECGDVSLLSRLVTWLEHPEVNTRLRGYLESGISYAAARQRAVADFDPAAAAVLSSPNDILGIEYMYAIRRQKAQIRPFCVKREGAAHDGGAAEGLASASHLRALLQSDVPEALLPYMPQAAYGLLEREYRADRVSDFSRLDMAVMSALRRMSPEAFRTLPDISEGLEYRLAQAAKEAPDMATFCDMVKTRRYSHARIRRICMAAFLGIRAGMTDIPIPYARVLAFNDTGRALLREIDAIPVIAKMADVLESRSALLPYLHLENLADDLYALTYRDKAARRGGQGIRTSPVYIPGAHSKID